MNRYTFAAGIPILLLAGLFSAHSAYACSPAPGYPQTASAGLAASSGAFIGTVQNVTKDAGENGDYNITFSVDNALKGSIGKIVTVATRSSSAACGYDDGVKAFAPETVWGIFTSGSASEGYRTNSLSGNTQYVSVDAAKQALAGVTATSLILTMPVGNLSLGSRGEGVKWIQQYLLSMHSGTKAESLMTAGATGYFGTITRAALAEFQQYAGIRPASGYFGAITRAHIASSTPGTATEDTSTATTFTGKIESVDTSCFADGICSVTVSGKKVILATGMRIGASNLQTGTLKGIDSIGDIQTNIGKAVQVYAQRVTNSTGDYTIIGSSDYYVKLVGDVPANGTVSVRGTIGCLPPSNPKGIHTMMCAFGLTGNDGNYYALKDSNSNYTNLIAVSSGSSVVVTGTFTAGTNPSYPSVGTIEVTQVK